MTPRAVLETWIDRFNAADIDGLASLYALDAINHQVTWEPLVGRAAIRDMFAREFESPKMTCIPEAVHEAGDVVALEWKDPLGLRGYWDRLSFLKLHNLPLES